MATSEARIQANRLNALKSTGPQTEAGKAVACRNALKHGMTASLVPHPDDVAPCQERVERWSDELGVAGDFEQSLIASAALAFTIQERAQVTEAALAHERVHGWVARRQRELDDRIQQLEETLRHWDRIRANPRDDGQGFGADYRTLQALIGNDPNRRPSDLLGLELEALHQRTLYDEDDRALLARFRKGKCFDTHSPLVREYNERAQARAALQPQLTAWLTRQRDRALARLQQLHAERADCEHATPPVDAWLDLSREAELRRRYAQAARREFHRHTAELDKHRRRIAREQAQARRVEVPPAGDLEDAAVVQPTAARNEPNAAPEPERNEPNAAAEATRNEPNRVAEAARNEANTSQKLSDPEYGLHELHRSGHPEVVGVTADRRGQLRDAS